MHISLDKEIAKFTQIEILYNILRNKYLLEIKEHPVAMLLLHQQKVCSRITEDICLEQLTP